MAGNAGWCSGMSDGASRETVGRRLRSALTPLSRTEGGGSMRMERNGPGCGASGECVSALVR